MKTLIAATIIATLSGTAFASAELPEQTIPGYGVEIGQPTAQRNMNIHHDLRAESPEYTIPGYGVEVGTASNTFASHSLGGQPEIGSVEVDYLGLNYPGAN